MNLKKFRWSKVYESSEEELLAYLHGRNYQAQLITAEALSEKSQQYSDPHTVWCAEGSLVIRSGSTKVSLQPGDAVTISANQPYDLIAGITGCTCYVTN